MTIPEKMKFLGLEWEVKHDKNVANQGNCYGSTHHSVQKIFLDPDNTALHNQQTFMHELMHAVFWQMGLGKKKDMTNELEEEIVHALSSGLFHALKDNDLLK